MDRGPVIPHKLPGYIYDVGLFVVIGPKSFSRVALGVTASGGPPPPGLRKPVEVLAGMTPSHDSWKTKSPLTLRSAGFCLYPGSVLLSHCLAAAVSSALEGLTAVFGMGTGVTPPVWPPGICKDHVYQEQSVMLSLTAD